MAKKKADWLAEARKAGIKGLTEENTIAQIRWALDAAKDLPATETKRLTPEEEQAQAVAEREERRAARRAEEAEAAANRAEDEAAAKAKIRTASQQAIDRAEASA